MKYQINTQTLLNAATGTTSSEWFNIADLDEKSLDIRISSSATVKVMVSNEPTQPTSANDGPQQGSDATGNAMVSFSSAAKWVKVKVSTFSSGTVTVYLVGNLFRRAPLAGIQV